MDGIKSMLDRLTDLSDVELNDLSNSIVAEFTSLESQEVTREVVDGMTFLADSMEAVRSEQARRADEKNTLSSEAEESAAVVKEEDASEEVEDEDPEDAEGGMEFTSTTATGSEFQSKDEAAEAAESEEEEAAESEEEEAAESEEEEAAEGDEPPTFFANETESSNVENVEAPMSEKTTEPVFSAPSDRLPVARTVESAPVTLVAGGDIPGVTAGSQLSGSNGLAEAFAQRLHSLRRTSGGNGEQVVVASLLANFGDERTLHTNEVASNNDKISKIVSPSALTASGGWCAPLPVKYDIFGVGASTETPVRDSLPVFNADRGGVRYVKSPSIGDYEGAINWWTNGDDIAAATDPAKRKECLTVKCAEETEIYLDAITMCLCFGNLQSRAFPELIERHNELALVQAARWAEIEILKKLKAASKPVAASQKLGVGRDLLISVERAATALRYKHRLPSNASLRFIAPEWVRNMIRSDITAQLPGDGMDTTFALADASIDRFFTARNIQPAWSIEGTSQPPTEDNYPDVVEWGLYAEGNFLLLDGGTLDIGIVRDMNLVQSNDYCMFTEQFLGVAPMGEAALWVTQEVKVNGSSAGTCDMCAQDY